MRLNNLSGILVVALVVIAVIAIILAWQNAVQRDHHRDEHHDGKVEDHGAKCVDPKARPGPPTGLNATSEELFSVCLTWTAPKDCDIDHYCIYLKCLQECPSDSPCPCRNSVNGARGGRAARRHHRRSPTRGRGGRHPRGCGCDVCSASSDSSESHHPRGCGCHSCSASSESHHPRGCRCNKCHSPSPSPCTPPPSPDADCGCGPDSYDRVVQVSGAECRAVISGLTSPAVCLAVTAVNGCGNESKVAECTTVCVNADCKIYPCIAQDDCRGVSLKWRRVGCADKIRIYYNGELEFEVPGDAGGVENLPAMGEGEGASEVITVTTVNFGGESEHQAVDTTCPTYNSHSRCNRCSKPVEHCSCGKH